MSKLKKPITVETAFDVYELCEQIGEGGAGTVYGGKASDGTPVAVKILSKIDTDKRKRFKNETAFLSKIDHPNIVKVIDHGLKVIGQSKAPFYVMPRYDASLRNLMDQGLPVEAVLPLFSQILDGVEAAHLNGATHRDLKPENVLVWQTGTKVVIADFGIANFIDAVQETAVITKPTTRLANFKYAAPEQKTAGKKVGVPADIYALGLMINELFTGEVPQGTNYKTIDAVSLEFAYLDAIVAKMIQQGPVARPQSIAAVKALIQKYEADAVSRQKISAIDGMVIPEGEIDNPLAFEPPVVVDARHDGNNLIITLDRDVNTAWVEVLHYRLGSYSNTMHAPPDRWRFSKNEAKAPVTEGSIPNAIEYFKQWLPKATAVLKMELEQSLKRKKKVELDRLRREREEEERILRINKSIKI